MVVGCTLYTLGDASEPQHESSIQHPLTAETLEGLTSMVKDYNAQNRTIVLLDATSSGMLKIL